MLFLWNAAAFGRWNALGLLPSRALHKYSILGRMFACHGIGAISVQTLCRCATIYFISKHMEFVPPPPKVEVTVPTVTPLISGALQAANLTRCYNVRTAQAV